MKDGRIKAFEMRHYDLNGELWVELSVVYMDGTESVVCNTECDADLIRVCIVESEEHQKGVN